MQNKFSISTGYKSQAIRTVFAIIFFILVYITVLLLSFTLVGVLIYSSTLLLQIVKMNKSSFYILILFILINFMAIVLLIFIFMFFFRKSTVDRSGWLEISEEDQPKLFELIKSISMEIETNFPQKGVFRCRC